MGKRALIAWVLFGALAVLSAPLWAAGPDLLDKGVERYEFAEFKEAAQLLKQALQKGDLGASQKARAYAYLGLVSLAHLAEGGHQGNLSRWPGQKLQDDLGDDTNSSS